MKLSKRILEEILFDKDLSDAIRDIVKNSVISLPHAYVCIIQSKNYERDSVIIKELANVGIKYPYIERVIINNN